MTQLNIFRQLCVHFLNYSEEKLFCTEIFPLSIFHSQFGCVFSFQRWIRTSGERES